MYELTCPNCQASATVKEGHEGKVVACPKCGQRMRVSLESDDEARARLGIRSGGGFLLGCSALLLGLTGAAGLVIVWALLGQGDQAGKKPAPRQVAAPDPKKAPPEVVQATKAEEKDKDAAPKGEKGKEDAKGKEDEKGKDAPKVSTPEAPKVPTPPAAVEEPTAAVAHSGEQIFPRLIRSVCWIVAPDGSSGSGAIVSRDDSLVITNQHVVGKNRQVAVVFPVYRDDRPIPENAYYRGLLARKDHATGEVVRLDVERDLALVRVSKLPTRGEALRLAPGSPNPGQRLWILGGNPQGSTSQWVQTEGTVRQVSYKEWVYDDRLPRKAQVIESQAPTNAGDSGAAVVDARCTLIGVNALAAAGRNNTGHIDVTEVRKFLGEYYASQGREWSEPKAPPPVEVASVDVDKVIQATQDRDVKVRRAACRKLAELGSGARKAVPDLIKVLRDKTEEKDVHLSALSALAEIGTPDQDQIPVLLAALTDETTPMGRVYAADALGKLGAQAKEAVPQLQKMVTHRDTHLRKAALGALVRIGRAADEGAFEGLLLGLKDADREVRVVAGLGLLKQGKPRASDAPTLAALLKDAAAHREARVYAAGGLTQLGPDHVPALAAAAFGDPDTGVVLVALEGLGLHKVQSPAVGDALTRTLTHPERQVRLAGVAALGKVGFDPTTVRPALKALISPDADVRQAALAALPRMRALSPSPPRISVGSELLPDLRAALASDNKEARLAAAFLLGTVQDDRAAAVTALKAALLPEKDADIKKELACSLAECGPAAKEALPELLETMKAAGDGHPLVARCAALAILRTGDRDSARETYRVLAKALELKDPRDPAPVEKEVHDRARRQLIRGAGAAALALANAYRNTFSGGDVTNQEKIQARKATLELLTSIGPPANIPEVRKLFQDIGRGTDHPDVLTAYREAVSAVIKK